MRKRNIQISLRLMPDEYETLRKHVMQSGLSQSAYLRLLISGNTPKALPPIDYHKLLRQLYAIGNSMNQITARANSTGFFLAEHYSHSAENLRQTLLEIQSAFTVPEKESYP